MVRKGEVSAAIGTESQLLEEKSMRRLEGGGRNGYKGSQKKRKRGSALKDQQGGTTAGGRIAGTQIREYRGIGRLQGNKRGETVPHEGKKGGKL